MRSSGVLRKARSKMARLTPPTTTRRPSGSVVPDAPTNVPSSGMWGAHSHSRVSRLRKCPVEGARSVSGLNPPHRNSPFSVAYATGCTRGSGRAQRRVQVHAPIWQQKTPSVPARYRLLPYCDQPYCSMGTGRDGSSVRRDFPPASCTL